MTPSRPPADTNGLLVVPHGRLADHLREALAYLAPAPRAADPGVAGHRTTTESA